MFSACKISQKLMIPSRHIVKLHQIIMQTFVCHTKVTSAQLYINRRYIYFVRYLYTSAVPLPVNGDYCAYDAYTSQEKFGLYHEDENLARVLNYCPEIKNMEEIEGDTLWYLKKCGFTWKELIRRKLYLLPFYRLKGRMRLLMEFGVFIHKFNLLFITTSHIDALMKCEIGVLKNCGFLREDKCVLEYLSNCIPDDADFAEAVDAAVTSFPLIHYSSLGELHFAVLKYYLQKRFSCSADIIDSIFKSHCPVWKPLSEYKEICDFILFDLLYTIQNVVKSPTLLDLIPLDSKTLIRDHERIGMTPTLEMISTYPGILSLPLHVLESWFSILDHHNVTHYKFSEAVLKLFKSRQYGKINARLGALSKLKEWEVIKFSDDLFQVLFKSVKVKYVINAMEAAADHSDIASASVTPYQPIRRKLRKWSPEIVRFLSFKLNLSEENVEYLLSNDVSTPLSIHNSCDIIEMLQQSGFNEYQISRCLSLLMYNKKVVANELEKFFGRPEVEEFGNIRQEPNAVELLLYFVVQSSLHTPFDK